MPTIRRSLIGLLSLVMCHATQVFGSWAAVPLEVLVDRADLIVVGRVVKVKDGGFQVGKRPYDVAVIKVSTVLKTLSGIEHPKMVHVGQPARGGLQTSIDIRFQSGQQGIWLLAKDPKREVYWARHPSQFQQDVQQEKLSALVENRANLPAGDAVDGIVARAELVKIAPENGSNYEVRFSLKNVSDGPIIICDYVGNMPLKVDWVGPDGERRNSQHYAWLALADLTGLMEQHFVTIPAGGVYFVGPMGGGDQGIYFMATEGVREDSGSNAIERGEHQVTMRFENSEDGRHFDRKKIWTGRVVANEVTLTVE